MPYFLSKTKKGLGICPDCMPNVWISADRGECFRQIKGKIALGGILSGIAYVTYRLVKNDKRAAEKLQLHLGPPDRVTQFERGFDRWRIDAYREQCYLFRNNLLIKTGPCANLQSDFSKRWTFAPPSIGGRFGLKTAPTRGLRKSY